MAFCSTSEPAVPQRPGQLFTVRRRHPTCSFSIRRERRMKSISSISPYQGSARRTVIRLTWLGADGDPALLGCLGIAENKAKSGTLLLQHQRTSSAIDRHYREQEITSSWRRNLQTSLTGKYTHTSQRNCILQKASGGSSISSSADWWKSSL